MRKLGGAEHGWRNPAPVAILGRNHVITPNFDKSGEIPLSSQYGTGMAPKSNPTIKALEKPCVTHCNARLYKW